MRLNLTQSNYYSQKANKAYWSASFVKSMLDCPSRALAELRGEYVRPYSTALLVGSYVDAHFEGTLDGFRAQHPEIYKRDGTLKSEYILANDMINRAEQDAVFMSYLDGERQKIITGEIDGIPFKSKLDVYKPGVRIVDLKTTKDMQPMYKPEHGRLSFAEYWNWPLQMAIYQHLEGNKLPVYLAVITKENPPDIAVIEIPQHILDAEMDALKSQLPYFDAMRKGIVEPVRCEHCAYCRATKKIKAPVLLDELMED